MKKVMSRVLALMLAVMLVVSALPAGNGGVTEAAKETYSIKYVLNKGSLPKGTSKKYTMGKGVKLAKATRTGYTFKGWYTNKKLSGKAVKSIGKKATGKKTLYAKWSVNKYNIKFNGNGSTSGTMSNKTKKNVKYGAKVKLPKNAFVKSGYTFDGWNTKKDGTGKGYKDSATVKNLSKKNKATVTLYAQWKSNSSSTTTPTPDSTSTPNPTPGPGSTPTPSPSPAPGSTQNPDSTPAPEDHTYTVIYVLNGGTNASSNPRTYKDSDVRDKDIALAAPTKLDYVFVGWYSDEYCTEETDNVIAQGSTGVKIFFAKWTPVEYTITYVMNGGTNADDNPPTYTMEKDVVLKTPTWLNHNFLGWYEDSDFKTPIEKIAKETKRNITIYAKWESETKYTVTFDANGGTGTMESKEYGATLFELPDCTFTPPENKEFAYWSMDPKGPSDTAMEPKSEFYNQNKTDVTIYAIWKDKVPEEESQSITVNTKLTADYYLDDVISGLIVSSDMAHYDNLDSLDSVSILDVLYVAAYEYHKKESGVPNIEVFNKLVDDYIITDHDKNVIGIKDEDGEEYYLRSIKVESGTNSNTYTIENNNSALTINALLNKPIKDGSSIVFTFDYVDGADGNGSEYNVTYVPNDGSSSKNHIKAHKGSSFILADPSFSAAEDMEFAGWSKSSETLPNDTANLMKEGSLYNNEKHTDVTLYAIWKYKEYKITYVLDSGTNAPGNPATYTSKSDVTLDPPTRYNHNFLGWYTDSEFKNKIETISKDTKKNITIYAQWENAIKYTINFDSNGGTGEMDSDESGSVSYTLPDCDFEAPEGKEFAGWSIYKNTPPNDTGGDLLNVGDILDITGYTEVTVYAIWMSIEDDDEPGEIQTVTVDVRIDCVDEDDYENIYSTLKQEAMEVSSNYTEENGYTQGYSTKYDDYVKKEDGVSILDIVLFLVNTHYSEDVQSVEYDDTWGLTLYMEDLSAYTFVSGKVNEADYNSIEDLISVSINDEDSIELILVPAW